MNAIPYRNRGEGWDASLSDDDFEGEMPSRPRRRFLTRWSALLFAIVLGAVGFFIGVRVEKGQLGSSTTGSLSGLASRFSAASTAGAGRFARSGRSGFPSTRGFAGGGFPGGFGGGTVGTVSSIDGNTLYVEETGGNTVKVKLSSVTKITKDESVGRNKIYPGDSVTISGSSGSKGTITATALTDSGSSGSSTSSSGSSTSSSSGTTGSSGVGSLFGG